MTNMTNIRIFEIFQSVTGYMDGALDDWPANIQDVIYKALEIKAKQERLPLAIVHSECKVDPDFPEGHPNRFYVHVVASEIVVADERNLLPGTVQRTLPQEMEYLKRDPRFRN